MYLSPVKRKMKTKTFGESGNFHNLLLFHIIHKLRIFVCQIYIFLLSLTDKQFAYYNLLQLKKDTNLIQIIYFGRKSLSQYFTTL